MGELLSAGPYFWPVKFALQSRVQWVVLYNQQRVGRGFVGRGFESHGLHISSLRACGPGTL